MKRNFLVCCFALVAIPLFAAGPLVTIQSMIARPSVLCGRFDQTKQLIGIKKPLASNGRFCVITDKGVLWRSLYPFQNTLRLTRDEIVQFQQDRVTMRLDAKQEPTVRVINSMLFAVLAGDLGRLESMFEADGSIQDNNWTVTFKAREAALAKVINSITLKGDAYVKTVNISEASGDRTAIVFSGIETGEGAIRAEEAALF